jgi:hypothetical protein
MDRKLNRLSEIADALDDTDAFGAVALIGEANRLVHEVVEHERSDESNVYMRLAKFLGEGPASAP